MIDDIANVVEVIVENGTRTPAYAVARNEDPSSPYSLANFKWRVVKTVREPTVPDPVGGLIDYTEEYAKHQLLMANWLTDRVTVPIAVNPVHARDLERDISGLNIYQQSVAAGASQDKPLPTTRQLRDCIAAGRGARPARKEQSDDDEQRRTLQGASHSVRALLHAPRLQY